MSNLSNTYTDDNNTDYSKLILKAFSDRKPEIAAFIVEQTKQKISFDKLDRYGRNIIHYLVIFYGFESLRNLLNSIIQNSSETKLKTILNVQDNLGNTPLHYAIMFNLNDLTSILINKGANPNLKNKDGNSIVTDKECDDNDNDYNDDDKDDDNTVNTDNTNSAKPKMKSLVILMKASPNDLSSIGNINSISNLDELSMSNASNNMSSDVFIRKNRDSLENSSIGINETDGRRNNLSAQEINSALEKIVKAFSQPSQLSQMSLSNDSETFKFDRNGLLTDTNTNSISALKNIKSDMRNMRNTDDVDTDNFAMAILDKLKSSKQKRVSQSQTQSQTNIEDDIPEDSWRVKQIPELVVGPRSGEPYVLSINSMNNDPTTDMMINKLRNPQYKSQLVGGKKIKKNKVTGKRKIHTFSELSYGVSKHKNIISENSLGEPIKTDDDFKEANNKITAELFEDKKKNSKKSEDSDDTIRENKDDEEQLDKKLTSELSEMARNIARQSSDIHERTIEKIAHILKLDLQNPEDNKTARYYKAAIWRLVKEEHPELSNYDRSVEMEKNITEEKLKSIDIEKVSKEIDKYFSDKSDTPKPKLTKPTLPISSETLTSDKPKKEKKEEKPKPKKDSKKETKKETKKKLKRMENSNETLSISTET